MANRANTSQIKTNGRGTGIKVEEKLLKAAKKLFARKGLSGTSIRDIASLAKVNSSMISYYFDSKEGLYRACIQEIGENRLSFARQILQTPENAEDMQVRLKLFAENLFSLYLEDKDAGLIIIREYDRIHSPAEKVFKSSFFEHFNLITEFFKNSQAKKIIPDGRDPFVLGSLFFGAVTSQMRLDPTKAKAFGRSIKDDHERALVLEHILDLFSH